MPMNKHVICIRDNSKQGIDIVTYCVIIVHSHKQTTGNNHEKRRIG